MHKDTKRVLGSISEAVTSIRFISDGEGTYEIRLEKSRSRRRLVHSNLDLCAFASTWDMVCAVVPYSRNPKLDFSSGFTATVDLDPSEALRLRYAATYSYDRQGQLGFDFL